MPPHAAVAPPPPASWDLSETELDELARDPSLVEASLPLRDWLLREGAHDEDAGRILSGIAEQLLALGVRIDRITTAIDALHSEYSGVGRFWTKEEGAMLRFFPHGEEADRIYEQSPFAHVHRTRRWLRVDLGEAPDELFSIVPELRAAGYRDYLCIPILFTNGTSNGITIASRTPGAFDRRALGLLRLIMPTVSAVMEMRAASRRLEDVLRIYVGDGPHRAILSGAIRRGEVSRIRSAILFADMRGYTRLSSMLSPEAAVELLNAYFDCLVPAIVEQGGEVLKYLGDGLLAIFRDRGDDTGGAAQSALSAAVDALLRIEAANGEGRFPERIAIGIALHHGEAAYGNVGSGMRLDFTVIGPDVNLASRIARLNKALGEPLLMSQAFVDHLWGDPEPMGRYEVDGFAETVPIYRLRAS